MATLLGPLHKANTQQCPAVVDTLLLIFCCVCLKHFWSGGFGITNPFLRSASNGEVSPLLSPGPHMGDEKVLGERKGLTCDDSVRLFPPRKESPLITLVKLDT